MLRFVAGLARWMALLGGVVLALLILIVCLSILGRTAADILHSGSIQALMPGVANWLLDIGVGPVNGDYELVEAGMAFTIFAFLPLCQVTAGHASVDLLTNFFPQPVQRFLRTLAEVIFAVALIIIAVQLYEGTYSKWRTGTVSFQLQFPIWWAYAASLSGAVVAAFVGVIVALMRLVELLTGRGILNDGSEAGH